MSDLLDSEVAALQTRVAQLEIARDEANRQQLYWRSMYLQLWGDQIDLAARDRAELVAENARLTAREAELTQENEALQQTLSWRITKPIRTVRTALARN